MLDLRAKPGELLSLWSDDQLCLQYLFAVIQDKKAAEWAFIQWDVDQRWHDTLMGDFVPSQDRRVYALTMDELLSDSTYEIMNSVFLIEYFGAEPVRQSTLQAISKVLEKCSSIAIVACDHLNIALHFPRTLLLKRDVLLFDGSPEQWNNLDELHRNSLLNFFR